MISDVSLKAVQNILLKKKEKINLDYKIVSKYSCKGENPSLLPISNNSDNKKNINEKPKLFHEI